MLKYIMVVGCLSLLAVLFNACGGGGEEGTDFTPRPVSSEYQNLSIDELKAKSNGLSWRDMAGKTDLEEGLMSEAETTKRIESHKGELVWFKGKVERIFEGTLEGTLQIWICTKEVKRAGVDCDDPILLLYSNDRGPSVEINDTVSMAGILVDSFKFTLSRGGGQGTKRIVSPMVSVIKAELVTTSE